MEPAAGGGTTLLRLSDIDVGTPVRVVEIDAARATVRHCLALGLTVGTELVVQQRRGHAVVVAADGNRVALGAEIAERIIAERVG